MQDNDTVKMKYWGEVVHIEEGLTYHLEFYSEARGQQDSSDKAGVFLMTCEEKPLWRVVAMFTTDPDASLEDWGTFQGATLAEGVLEEEISSEEIMKRLGFAVVEDDNEAA